jgi:phage regulator Rha-like protein
MSKTSGRGGRRYLPYVFTEQGVTMLSSVLNSKRAIQVNIAIVRAFVKLRKILSTHKKLAHKLQELEKKIKKQDEKIYTIFEAINSLMAPPEKKRRKIGFKRVKE